jgi:hypothetical protein
MFERASPHGKTVTARFCEKNSETPSWRSGRNPKEKNYKFYLMKERQRLRTTLNPLNWKA